MLKPFKNRTLENLLEESPTPQHGQVPVGLLGPQGPQARLRRLFQYSWGSSVLLGMDYYSLLAPEH